MRNFQYNEYRDRYDSEWEDIDNDSNNKIPMSSI